MSVDNKAHPDYDPELGEVVYRHKNNLDCTKSELFDHEADEVSDDRWREFCSFNDDDGYLRDIVQRVLREQLAEFPYPFADR